VAFSASQSAVVPGSSDGEQVAIEKRDARHPGFA
jgi:hypothetical protein